MNSDKRQAAGRPVLAALLGLLVALVVFAGPASADAHWDGDKGTKATKAKGADKKAAPSRGSGGCVATDGSVCSGESVADDHSTASGASTADDGSVASGGLPDRDKDGKKPDGKKPDGKKPHDKKPDGKKWPRGGGQLPTAGPAQAQQVGEGELAFTGPSVGPELALAGVLLLAGTALMVAGAERRRAVPSS